MHFLLCCPGFDDSREEYISKKSYNNPSLFKVTMLLASQAKTVILNLSDYVHKAFNRNEAILELDNFELCSYCLLLNEWCVLAFAVACIVFL